MFIDNETKKLVEEGTQVGSFLFTVQIIKRLSERKSAGKIVVEETHSLTIQRKEKK